MSTKTTAVGFVNNNVNIKKANSLSNLLPRAKCSMWGALALGFRVCQLAGIAPVKFARMRDGHLVCVSLAVTGASFMIETAFIVSACSALYIDVQGPPELSVRMFSSTRRFVWLFDFGMVLMVSAIAVYRGPKRTAEVLKCLNQIRKVKQNLNCPCARKSEELKRSILLLVSAAGCGTIIVLDILFIIRTAVIFDPSGRQTQVTIMYLGYYYGYVTLFALEIQFVLCALEILSAIKSLNGLLEEVQQLVTIQKTQGYRRINMVTAKNINQAIDSMYCDRFYPGLNKSSLKSVEETIRHLALMYNDACEAVRRLNSCFTPELMMLLMSFLLHMVVTPYNLIVNISGEIDVTLLMMESLWCVTHFLCTFAVVEPSHVTMNEMKRTSLLVSQLMLESSDEAVKRELRTFGEYLALSDVVYAPMDICVLNRSLMASILASVTTYLVIIIQFHATEGSNDRVAPIQKT